MVERTPRRTTAKEIIERRRVKHRQLYEKWHSQDSSTLPSLIETPKSPTIRKKVLAIFHQGQPLPKK
jgi:hypothetical protein